MGAPTDLPDLPDPWVARGDAGDPGASDLLDLLDDLGRALRRAEGRSAPPGPGVPGRGAGSGTLDAEQEQVLEAPPSNPSSDRLEASSG